MKTLIPQVVAVSLDAQEPIVIFMEGIGLGPVGQGHHVPGEGRDLPALRREDVDRIDVAAAEIDPAVGPHNGHGRGPSQELIRDRGLNLGRAKRTVGRDERIPVKLQDRFEGPIVKLDEVLDRPLPDVLRGDLLVPQIGPGRRDPYIIEFARQEALSEINALLIKEDDLIAKAL